MAKNKALNRDYIGAGIVFITPRKEILLLKKYNNKLTFPGGHREHYETLPYETALRECQEELGVTPKGNIIGKMKITKKDLPIYSFFMEIEDTFTPTLSTEHKGYKWMHYKKVPVNKLSNVFKPVWKLYKKYLSILP